VRGTGPESERGGLAAQLPWGSVCYPGFGQKRKNGERGDAAESRENKTKGERPNSDKKNHAKRLGLGPKINQGKHTRPTRNAGIAKKPRGKKKAKAMQCEE